MTVIAKANDSVVVDSQTNLAAVATLPATAGYKWRVTGVKASYSGAAVATPTRAVLAVGGVNVGVGISTNDGWKESFFHGVDGADGAAVTLTLPAGGAGAVGDVMLAGVKVPTLPAGRGE